MFNMFILKFKKNNNFIKKKGLMLVEMAKVLIENGASKVRTRSILDKCRFKSFLTIQTRFIQL